MTHHSGACRCGGVEIMAAGNASFAGYCHCDDCRRSNGAPVASFVGFEQSQLNWVTKKSLAEWRNGQYGRLFCKSCGSPIAYKDDELPDVTFFYIGFMADRSAFPPKHHSYYHQKLGWLSLADDLPKFNETSYPRPENTRQE